MTRWHLTHRVCLSAIARRKLLKSTVAALAAALSFASCDSASTSNQQTPANDEALSSKPCDALEKLVEPNGGYGGAILTIARFDGQVLIRCATGERIHDSGTDIEATDLFEIASISKLFTAATILGLVDNKLLASLDTKLADVTAPDGSKMNPEIYANLVFDSEGEDRSSELTIRKLLTQRNGLVDYWDDENFLKEYCADPNRLWQPEELIEFVRMSDAEWVGTASLEDVKFNYTDTGYVLLGFVIETATGIALRDAYADFIYKRTSQPLQSTYMEWRQPPPNTNQPRLSHRYEEQCSARGIPQDITVQERQTAEWAGGGLISTSADLTLFAASLLGAQFFDKDLTAELKKSLMPVMDTQSYGFGLMELEAGDIKYVGHTGHGDAFSYAVSELELVISGTFNNASAMSDGAEDDSLIGDRVARLLEAIAVDLPAVAARKHERPSPAAS